LPIITNNPSNSPEKEEILLSKINHLEKQSAEVQAENDRLRIEKEAERQRADQLEIKLKTVAKFLYQLQKINYYKKLEQEQKAQIEQLPP